MYIKENLYKKSSFINKQLLNAPKQKYKISFITDQINEENYLVFIITFLSVISSLSFIG